MAGVTLGPEAGDWEGIRDPYLIEGSRGGARTTIGTSHAEAPANGEGRTLNLYAVHMVVLSLDSSTRAGSVAVARDGVLLAELVGDATVTHGQRLPGDIVRALQACGVRLADVDLYAVSAGPGSFTGIRVGVATIQGLAFAHRRRVVPVSSLEALAHAARGFAAPGELIGAWIDAHRREVFASLYRAEGMDAIEPVAGPSVAGPAAILADWAGRRGAGAWFIGDAALPSRALIREAWGTAARFVDPTPPLAGVIARIAALRADTAVAPHAIRPLYVRRPDAEIARDKQRALP
jgi:tRNA threonylcarbamoyladenosine biosynthesis protein TsaB